jgi:dihydrofolate synthase / folylpolyglutamate synthase
VNYREALAWLYRLERFGIKLGLDNIRRLLGKLHVDPHGAGLVLHVAGTNGKGSVCAMIDAIAREGGYATGLFTSPHLITFRERIRVNGEMISEDAVARGLTKIRDLVRGWNPHPTFFEVTTALALKHFADAKIDIVILETGLGGRLDATNVVHSNVAVITPIDLDHEEWLGQSIREIASEKAGIIKAKTSVVSARQQPAAAQVIRARADECEAPLQFVNDQYERSPIALRGPHQKQNAAIAIAALRAAEIDPPSLGSGATGIDESAIARGLLSIDWPARFQLWDERTIIDGAHNPAAARVLAETWREVFGDQRATLILAILSDKDLRGICDALAPISDYVLLPKIRGERAAEPSDIAQVLASVCRPGASPAGNRSGCPTISLAPSIADAFDDARAKPNPILLTGSLHFTGEALAFLRGEPAAFEECAQ